MAHTAKRGNSFWAIADFFRECAGSAWGPTHAGYEVVRRASGGGYSWVVRLKVHVAPASRRARAGHVFKASVTWWPTKPRPTTRAEIVADRNGWFAAVKRTMARAGYRGTWAPSPHGTYADFWKDLTSVAHVRREARLLEAINVAGAQPTGRKK